MGKLIDHWDIYFSGNPVPLTLRRKVDRVAYRVVHDTERVNWNSKDYRYRGNVSLYMNDLHGGPVRSPVIERKEPLPEVYRLDPDHHTVLDCYWQQIWRDLNWQLSNKKWATLLGNGLAWTNNTGFPGHYDCVNDLEPTKPAPRFDQARVNGGAVVLGKEIGELLLIDSLDVNDRSRSASEILAMPWLWYWGTSINPRGEINYITREGTDGNFYPVRIPLVTDYPVYLPLSHFHKLPAGKVWPDPRWVS